MKPDRIPGEGRHTGLTGLRGHHEVFRLAAWRVGSLPGLLAEVPGGVGVGAGGGPRWNHDGWRTETGEVLEGDSLPVLSLLWLLQTVYWS